MDPIGSVDQLALLLRQKLAERSRAAATARKPVRGGGASDVRGSAAPEGALGLADIVGADDHRLHRALVQQILADGFGDAMINDARFQQLVTRVADALADDPVSARLLQSVSQDLRRS